MNPLIQQILKMQDMIQLGYGNEFLFIFTNIMCINTYICIYFICVCISPESINKFMLYMIVLVSTDS